MFGLFLRVPFLHTLVFMHSENFFVTLYIHITIYNLLMLFTVHTHTPGVSWVNVTHLYDFRNKLKNITIFDVFIIGASLSDPHTSDYNGGIFIYIYLSYVVP